MCNRNWPIFLKIYNLSCVTTANNALNIFLLCVLMYVKTALQLEIVKIHTRYLDVSNKQPLISYINHYCIRGSFTVGRDLHTVYIHRDIIALREWERLNYNCHIKKYMTEATKCSGALTFTINIDLQKLLGGLASNLLEIQMNGILG